MAGASPRLLHKSADNGPEVPKGIATNKALEAQFRAELHEKSKKYKFKNRLRYLSRVISRGELTSTSKSSRIAGERIARIDASGTASLDGQAYRDGNLRA